MVCDKNHRSGEARLLSLPRALSTRVLAATPLLEVLAFRLISARDGW
jgi:hypothetical protein